MRTTEGRIAPGMRLSPATEFKPGEHWRAPQPFRENGWLESEYVAAARSTGDIAAQFGTTDAAILFWLKKHGIPRRHVSAARALKHWGLSGPANPQFGRRGPLSASYIDGSSPERQRQYARAEGREFLVKALKAGGYCCARCAGKQVGSNPLHVHHLKGLAKNPALRLDLSNVAVLCRNCHLYVHSNKNTTREFLHG